MFLKEITPDAPGLSWNIGQRGGTSMVHDKEQLGRHLEELHHNVKVGIMGPCEVRNKCVRQVGPPVSEEDE